MSAANGAHRIHHDQLGACRQLLSWQASSPKSHACKKLFHIKYPRTIATHLLSQTPQKAVGLAKPNYGAKRAELNDGCLLSSLAEICTYAWQLQTHAGTEIWYLKETCTFQQLLICMYSLKQGRLHVCCFAQWMFYINLSMFWGFQLFRVAVHQK